MKLGSGAGRVNKLFKVLLACGIAILVLPVVFYGGLLVYALLNVAEVQQRSADIASEQARLAKAGNGFGGEVGMDVVDSGYLSDKFFWLDNDHLLFKALTTKKIPDIPYPNMVWNLQTGVVKPLIPKLSVKRFHKGKLDYTRTIAGEFQDNGRQKWGSFQATLREHAEHWDIEDEQNFEDIYPAPSDRYELRWGPDGPRYKVKRDLHIEGDYPVHSAKYLLEWGWILRTPRKSIQAYNQSIPEMGLFAIDDEIYAQQEGKKIVPSVDIDRKVLAYIELAYVAFLDKYWLANRLHGRKSEPLYIGFLNPDGSFQRLKWPDNRSNYDGIPIPTRKGLLWSGLDPGLSEHTMYDSNTYLRVSDQREVKIMKGTSLRLAMTNNGCRVASHNIARIDKAVVTLKVFNVCQSTMDGKELKDVSY